MVSRYQVPMLSPLRENRLCLFNSDVPKQSSEIAESIKSRERYDKKAAKSPQHDPTVHKRCKTRTERRRQKENKDKRREDPDAALDRKLELMKRRQRMQLWLDQILPLENLHIGPSKAPQEKNYEQVGIYNRQNNHLLDLEATSTQKERLVIFKQIIFQSKAVKELRALGKIDDDDVRYATHLITRQKQVRPWLAKANLSDVDLVRPTKVLVGGPHEQFGVYRNGLHIADIYTFPHRGIFTQSKLIRKVREALEKPKKRD